MADRGNSGQSAGSGRSRLTLLSVESPAAGRRRFHVSWEYFDQDREAVQQPHVFESSPRGGVHPPTDRADDQAIVSKEEKKNYKDAVSGSENISTDPMAPADGSDQEIGRQEETSGGGRLLGKGTLVSVSYRPTHQTQIPYKKRYRLDERSGSGGGGKDEVNPSDQETVMGCEQQEKKSSSNLDRILMPPPPPVKCYKSDEAISGAVAGEKVDLISGGNGKSASVEKKLFSSVLDRILMPPPPPRPPPVKLYNPEDSLSEKEKLHSVISDRLLSRMFKPPRPPTPTHVKRYKPDACFSGGVDEEKLYSSYIERILMPPPPVNGYKADEGCSSGGGEFINPEKLTSSYFDKISKPPPPLPPVKRYKLDEGCSSGGGEVNPGAEETAREEEKLSSSFLDMILMPPPPPVKHDNPDEGSSCEVVDPSEKSLIRDDEVNSGGKGKNVMTSGVGLFDPNPDSTTNLAPGSRNFPVEAYCFHKNLNSSEVTKKCYSALNLTPEQASTIPSFPQMTETGSLYVLESSPITVFDTNGRRWRMDLTAYRHGHIQLYQLGGDWIKFVFSHHLGEGDTICFYKNRDPRVVAHDYYYIILCRKSFAVRKRPLTLRIRYSKERRKATSGLDEITHNLYKLAPGSRDLPAEAFCFRKVLSPSEVDAQDYRILDLTPQQASTIPSCPNIAATLTDSPYVLESSEMAVFDLNDRRWNMVVVAYRHQGMEAIYRIGGEWESYAHCYRLKGRDTIVLYRNWDPRVVANDYYYVIHQNI